MNEKIVIATILTIFMLTIISLTTATNMQKIESTEKKISPLYKIRTEKAIGSKLEWIINRIHTRFVNGRLYLNIENPKFFRYRLENTGYTDCPTTVVCTCQCTISMPWCK